MFISALVLLLKIERQAFAPVLVLGIMLQIKQFPLFPSNPGVRCMFKHIISCLLAKDSLLISQLEGTV